MAQPYTTLSENLNGKHIQMLIREISRHIDNYDGIIITHGTDTLQYTAAALGIVLEKINIPVMLVSSNYPLEDERANGLSNFECAVNYIKGKREPGVYVSYKNNADNTKIYPAINLANHDMYSDDIREVYVDTCKDKFKIANSPQEIEINEKSNILFIKPYPGMSYAYNVDNIKAILFGSYHSGTIATADVQLEEFCKKAKAKNIPMYIAGVPEGAHYESTKYYEDLGIEILPQGTDIYWYMKIWLS